MAVKDVVAMMVEGERRRRSEANLFDWVPFAQRRSLPETKLSSTRSA